VVSLTLGLAAAACGESKAAQTPPLDAELARYVLDDVPTDIEHKTFFDFEGKAHLVGYAIKPEGEAKPGTNVQLTLYWKSVAPLRGGWQLFTHLIDPTGPRGQLVTNLDGSGPLRQKTTVAGREIQKLAPAFWQPGHVYIDEQSFDIPKETKAKALTLTVGIWQDGAWRRRPAAETDAAAPEPPSSRLHVISGASDGESRAILAHIPTGIGREDVAKKDDH
jgi:hypothetical protein